MKDCKLFRAGTFSYKEYVLCLSTMEPHSQLGTENIIVIIGADSVGWSTHSKKIAGAQHAPAVPAISSSPSLPEPTAHCGMQEALVGMERSEGGVWLWRGGMGQGRVRAGTGRGRAEVRAWGKWWSGGRTGAEQ